MTEKQSTLFNKRRKDAARAHANGSVFSCGLLMAGAFILLAIVVAPFGASGFPVRQDPEPVKVRTFPPPRRNTRTPPPVFEVSETYYRTIIENNLFRSLGWTPPRPKEPYRLSGTVIPTDGNKSRYAIVQTTIKNKTHIVTPGGNWILTSSSLTSNRKSGSFNFKKLLGFTSFFQVSDSVGMHVAFGRVRRKTEPTGPRGENSIEKWTIELP